MDLPTRMALLRHVLPDGSWHFDWMIEPAPGRGLISFRVSRRIDLEGARGFDADSIGVHRTAYLDYEGPVSRNRGEVWRVAAGRCRVEGESVARLVLLADWGDGARRLAGAPTGAGSAWRFEAVADKPPSPAGR